MKRIGTGKPAWGASLIYKRVEAANHRRRIGTRWRRGSRAADGGGSPAARHSVPSAWLGLYLAQLKEVVNDLAWTSCSGTTPCSYERCRHPC